MALYLDHRKNRGAHIEGKGMSIDVIVTSITGNSRKREAMLKIVGVKGLDSLQLFQGEGFKRLTDDISIGIPDSSRLEYFVNNKQNHQMVKLIDAHGYNMVGHHSREVILMYKVGDDYKIERRNYKK